MSMTSRKKSYSYDASPHKTPKMKELVKASSSFDGANDVSPNLPIVMDEYGQTPDHYYLAKKAPSFYQVRRKLDLQTLASAKVVKTKANQRRKRKKGGSEKIGRNKTDKPRYDTSLGQLTKKFLKLLADATDGIINLNSACTLLSVPKRRLYDITNVLEGAGLIQKTSRNNIQWKGRISSPCASVVKYELEREIDLLEAKENKLDELIYHMKCEINTVKETDEKYHYVTSDDLTSLEEFSNMMLIGVNKPPGVHVSESTDKTLVVTSKTTEIEAKLLCDDSFKSLIAQKQNYSKILRCYSLKIDKTFFISSEIAKPPVKEICPEILPSQIIISESDLHNPEMTQGTVWDEYFEEDPVIKNAFITLDDDIAPMGKHFLLQTEDQDLPYSYLDNTVDAYSFSLDVGEGLTDLYDCSFTCP